MNIAGFASYLVGALLFLMLAALLLTSWRGRLQGALLVAAALMSTLWSGFLAFTATGTVPIPVTWVLVAEALRDATWLIFLLRLLGAGEGVSLPARLGWFVHPLWAALVVYTLAVSIDPALMAGVRYAVAAPLICLFVLSLTGVVLVEQIYRNSRATSRWAIKFLCIGLGAMFAYDLVVFSYALMLRGLDRNLWDARGLINALVVPLIAVSAARNPSWSLDVFVSRRMVFYSTTLLGAGIYLIAVAAGGYYIRLYGGSWGTLAAAIFLFGAAILLLLLLFSGRARARVRIFVSKHFFNYRYDYREEWLRLIATLSHADGRMALPERCIMALAQVTDSRGGVLWTRDGRSFRPTAGWRMSLPDITQPAGDEFIGLLEDRQWIFDLEEWRAAPASYDDIPAPEWLQATPQAWIVIPLLQEGTMTGFVMLAKPPVYRALNWEDLDLLKTAGRQVASYLGQHESARKLAEASQFEGYNRLTAFVMHDLKNLVAQQSLMVTNAMKYKRNPAFVDDMIATVSNSVTRMNRLLEQLRRGEVEGAPRRAALEDLVAQAVAENRERHPAPQLTPAAEPVAVKVEVDRFCAILGHVIRNAQEATPPEGHVWVTLGREDGNAVIEVRDDGTGMDADFIRERLFRPFFTTKSSKGMGIGAYQVREYVTAAGGSVEVISAPGSGTRFIIRLPAEPAELADAQPAPAQVQGM